jgi:hypothetical protein
VTSLRFCKKVWISVFFPSLDAAYSRDGRNKLQLDRSLSMWCLHNFREVGDRKNKLQSDRDHSREVNISQRCLSEVSRQEAVVLVIESCGISRASAARPKIPSNRARRPGPPHFHINSPTSPMRDAAVASHPARLKCASSQFQILPDDAIFHSLA